ncbi:hypothetical protein [Methylorubrum sp. Q1]|uniref:hypothetical protein n=1 Tax=Methylorubrum sp. Q1 TaxID=2562453 RepID=UPI001FE1460C|nr:hypothetical protein [Methylorubrum sp. Q1]
MGDWAVGPFDAAGDLEEGESVLTHQRAVIDHAARDDDAVAETGIRYSLAARLAGTVSAVDTAGGVSAGMARAQPKTCPVWLCREHWSSSAFGPDLLFLVKTFY